MGRAELHSIAENGKTEDRAEQYSKGQAEPWARAVNEKNEGRADKQSEAAVGMGQAKQYQLSQKIGRAELYSIEENEKTEDRAE
jgi:hypothetical protein